CRVGGMTACEIAALVLTGTGLLGLCGSRMAWIAAGGAVVAAAIGVPAALRVLGDGHASEGRIAWAAPVSEGRLGLGQLSPVLEIPLLVLGALCAVYGVRYLGRARHPGPPAAMFNVLLSAMLIVVLARDAVLFLVAWEVMTLASYLLVVHD